MKLQALDDLLLNLVVFEACRINGMTPLRKAAGYLRKVWGNKHSHTDSISPSLGVEGAMHE